MLRVRADKEWLAIAVLGGFAEVENNEVTVLVNAAERGDKIDLEEARAAFSQADERLKGVKEDDRQGKFQATQAYRRARARLQAAGGLVSV